MLLRILTDWFCVFLKFPLENVQLMNFNSVNFNFIFRIMSKIIDLKFFRKKFLIDIFNSFSWQLRFEIWKNTRFRRAEIFPQLCASWAALRVVIFVQIFFICALKCTEKEKNQIKKRKVEVESLSVKSQNVCQKSKRKLSQIPLSWSLMILESVIWDTLTLFLFNQNWKYFLFTHFLITLLIFYVHKIHILNKKNHHV